jgi:hypothetical protein
MTYLVYCILRGDGQTHGSLPLAGSQESVCLVTEQGLAAAVSQVLDSDVRPTVRRLRTFAAVIEGLHEMHTVLPMRYGCLLPTRAQVVALLRERGPEFADALDGVEGCTEMSIRAILDEKRIATSSPPAPFDLPDVSVGKAYLAARKANYARQTLSAQAATAIVERAAAVLRGLFVRYVSEYSPFPSAPYDVPMLSLHFLVRRAHIESFRRVFRMLEFSESAKMLLSGPWPPYNFVQVEKGQFP